MLEEYFGYFWRSMRAWMTETFRCNLPIFLQIHFSVPIDCVQPSYQLELTDLQSSDSMPNVFRYGT